MTSTYKRSKRRGTQWFDSSGSESGMLLYEKERLAKTKEVQKTLQTLCDNEEDKNSTKKSFLPGTKSVTKNDSLISRTNAIDNKTRNKDNKESGYLSRNVRTSNVSGNDNSNVGSHKQNMAGDEDHPRNTKQNSSESVAGNETWRKEDASDHESGKNSYDSATFLAKQRREFLKLSDANTRKGWRNRAKILRHSQIIESETSEDEFSDHGLTVTTTLTKRRKLENTNKQQIVPNFKPCIMKVMDELSHTFSTFESRMNHIAEKYLKDEILQHEDAGDIAFILSCFISKLKEELNERQKDLTDSYLKWSKEHKIRNISSEKRSEHDNNNSLTKRKACSKPSSDSDDIFSVNKYTKTPLNIIRSSKKIDTLRAKNITPKNGARNNKNHSSMNTNDNETNIHLRTTHNFSPILGHLKDIVVFKRSSRNSTENFLTRRTSESDLELLDQEYKEASRRSPDLVKDLSKGDTVAEKNQALAYDSDVNSSCSTVALYPLSRNRNSKRNKKYISKSIDDSLEVKSTSEASITNEQIINEIQLLTSYLSDSSDDSVIFPSNKTINRKHRSKNRGTVSKIKGALSKLSDSENSADNERQSESAIPKASTFIRNNHVKCRNDSDTHAGHSVKKTRHMEHENNYYMADKKLQMNCKVLIDRFQIRIK